MDFIHRPKSKILKILKNLKKLNSQRFGSWLFFCLQVNGGEEEKNTFSPSIHLRTEAKPASETL
jgi:hypothetical protein